MWDRLRQKEVTAPSLDRKKLEAWQNSHSSSTARGVVGGNSQYQYAVRGGPTPIRRPTDVNYALSNGSKDVTVSADDSVMQRPQVRTDLHVSKQQEGAFDNFNMPHIYRVQHDWSGTGR
ncbi:hypothetical protein F5Y03DRAFT_397238 [Xylaria venustula]|nr:hypothetical protein F5Y03DRAFT_397238 [Xylaria venustula]